MGWGSPSGPAGPTGSDGVGVFGNITRTVSSDVADSAQHLTLQDALNHFDYGFCGDNCNIKVIGILLIVTNINASYKEDLDFSRFSGHINFIVDAAIAKGSDGVGYNQGGQVVSTEAFAGSGKITITSDATSTTISCDGVQPDFDQIDRLPDTEQVLHFESSGVDDQFLTSTSTNTFISAASGAVKQFWCFRPRIEWETLSGLILNLTRPNQHVSIKNMFFRPKTASGKLFVSGGAKLDFENCVIEPPGTSGSFATNHMDVTDGTLEFIGDSNCMIHGAFVGGGKVIADSGVVMSRPILKNKGALLRGKNMQMGSTSGNTPDIDLKKCEVDWEDSQTISADIVFDNCKTLLENFNHDTGSGSKFVKFNGGDAEVNNSTFSDSGALFRFLADKGANVFGEDNTFEDNTLVAVAADNGGKVNFTGTTLTNNGTDTSPAGGLIDTEGSMVKT